jgi:hypothetical protein
LLNPLPNGPGDPIYPTALMLICHRKIGLICLWGMS